MNSVPRDRVVGSANITYAGAGEAKLNMDTLSTAAGYTANVMRISSSAAGVFGVTVANAAAPTDAVATSGTPVAQRAFRLVANASMEIPVEDCTRVSIHSSVAATVEVTLVRRAPDWAIAVS